MDLIPRKAARRRRDWLLVLPLACILLLGACIMLFSPSRFHNTAHAASTTVTPISDPFVQIISPTNTTLFTNQAPILITALASGGSSLTVRQVNFSVDGTQIGSSTVTPYSASWTTVTPGAHTLLATAVFTDGFPLNSPSFPVTVLVGGSPTPTITPSQTPTPTITPSQTPTPTSPPGPTVSLTSPANGATFALPATITVAASASTTAGIITKVDFVASLARNAPSPVALIGTSTAPPYQITWDPGTNFIGNVNLSAVATDSLGRSVTSAVVTIEILSETAGCSVHYLLNNQWAGGFSANVTIFNVGSVTLSGWRLQFTFPGDQHITQFWNGNATQQGEGVTITNLSYNGTILPGGSTALGFNGSWTSNNSPPTSFTLNGMACITL